MERLANFFQTELLEAGCDEAGRGCLAGPVFAAAVILPKEFYHPDLNDSKQLSEAKREELRVVVEERALAWAVAEVSPERIDEINILNASFEAMESAVKQLLPQPAMLLIDGNRFKTSLDIPYKCIVGGDGIYANIAAASILAKTHRDERMRQLSMKYPQYSWESNKGYPTRAHKAAIVEHGVTPHHRRSFGNLSQLKLF